MHSRFGLANYGYDFDAQCVRYGLGHRLINPKGYVCTRLEQLRVAVVMQQMFVQNAMERNHHPVQNTWSEIAFIN